MRFAGIVFLISGLAYLGWDLSLVISQRASIGSMVMTVFAGALLYQAYALFKNKPGARWGAILSATVIAIASGYVASVVVLPPGGQNLLELPAAVWPAFGGAITVCVVYTVVVVLLGSTRRSPAIKSPRPDAEKRRG